MAKVKNIEKKIWDTEGFDVKIRKNGKDVRGDMNLPTNYESFQRSAKNDLTVNEWKTNRFKSTFPGFEVDVLDASGEKVTGNTKLANVRNSYNEDD